MLDKVGFVNCGTLVDSTAIFFLLIEQAIKLTLLFVFNDNNLTTGVKFLNLACAYPTSPRPVIVTAGAEILN